MFEKPYSAKGLRKRASKLKDCPYKLLLKLVADQVEVKKVPEKNAKKAIEYIRSNNPVLTGVAIEMLHLNQEQISIMVDLLKKMEE